MEDTVKIFVFGLKKWAKLNRVNQTQLGEVIGRTQTTISDYYNGISRPDMEMIQKWVDHFNLEYDEIIEIGRKEILPASPSPIDPAVRILHEALDETGRKITPAQAEKLAQVLRQMLESDVPEKNTGTTDISQKHHQIIDQFINKDIAIEIDENLVEIEKKDPNKLKDIGMFIKGVLAGLPSGQSTTQKKVSGND